jgi:hypothetical protein
MAERGAHATTVLDCPGELTGGPARLVGVIVDPFTVLGGRRADESLQARPPCADMQWVREASPADERGNVPTSYPVEFEMDFVQRRSRLTTFFRSLLAVPQMLFAVVYGLAFLVVYVMAWFALMFTGRWPEGLYEFAGGFVRYITRLGAYLYLGTDQYPPFNGAPDDTYPVRVHIAPPLASYSRVKVFFRPLYAILASIIRSALGTVIAAVAFLSWFAIVFTGRQPAGLQNALSFSLSYTARADSLLYLITETYPPLSETAPPAIQPAV